MKYILKKLKINTKKGAVRQIRFFDIPILQYYRTDQRKMSLCPPLNRVKNGRVVFYLKINTLNTQFFARECLQRWLDIISELGADYYIVCDNIELEYKMLNNILFPDNEIKFIKSDRKTFKKVIFNICDKFWENTTYAHLTSFSHAKKHKIENFWNIDADDMMFYYSANCIAKGLKKVMEYAQKNKIDTFTYDLSRSFSYGTVWTFGITYIQNSEKHFELINSIKDRNWIKKYAHILPSGNLDLLFNYFLDDKIANVQTFAFENVYFTHWGAASPYWQSSLLQVLNDKIWIKPFAKGLGMDEHLYKTPLCQDVVPFDIGVSETQGYREVFDTNTKDLIRCSEFTKVKLSTSFPNTIKEAWAKSNI